MNPGLGRLQLLPKGLASGLFAGFAVALVGTTIFGQNPLLRNLETHTQVTQISQDIDDLRIAALKTRPSAGGLPLVSQRLLASGDWLQQPASRQLTIQILLTEDDDLHAVEKLLQKQSYQALLPDVYLYRSEVAGRQRWNLLFGEFESKTKALAALADLPERVRLRQPYLRSLDALRTNYQATRIVAHKEGLG